MNTRDASAPAEESPILRRLIDSFPAATTDTGAPTDDTGPPLTEAGVRQAVADTTAFFLPTTEGVDKLPTELTKVGSDVAAYFESRKSR